MVIKANANATRYSVYRLKFLFRFTWIRIGYILLSTLIWSIYLWPHITDKGMRIDWAVREIDS